MRVGRCFWFSPSFLFASRLLWQSVYFNLSTHHSVRVASVAAAAGLDIPPSSSVDDESAQRRLSVCSDLSDAPAAATAGAAPGAAAPRQWTVVVSPAGEKGGAPPPSLQVPVESPAPLLRQATLSRAAAVTAAPTAATASAAAPTASAKYFMQPGAAASAGGVSTARTLGGRTAAAGDTGLPLAGAASEATFGDELTAEPVIGALVSLALVSDDEGVWTLIARALSNLCPTRGALDKLLAHEQG